MICDWQPPVSKLQRLQHLLLVFTQLISYIQGLPLQRQTCIQITQNKTTTIGIWGWIDGSSVKSIWCFFRGQGFCTYICMYVCMYACNFHLGQRIILKALGNEAPFLHLHLWEPSTYVEHICTGIQACIHFFFVSFDKFLEERERKNKKLGK